MSRNVIFGEEHGHLRIVLVHGFRGSAKLTWGKFPALIETDPDLPVLRGLSWGYETGFFNRCSGIGRVGEQLVTELAAGPSRSSEIVVVGHSVGGLVILQAITKEMIDRGALKNPASRIARIALFATPLDGQLVRQLLRGIIASPIGLFARLVLRNRQLQELYSIKLVNNLRREVIDRIYLKSPTGDTESGRHIQIHTFVADQDRVVTEDSVKAWFRSPPPRALQDTDHNSIKLPPDRRDLRYRVLADILEDLISPWFHKLIALATDRFGRDRHSAFVRLLRAYFVCLQTRLDEVVDTRQMPLATRIREIRKLLALTIQQATRCPEQPVWVLLQDAMLAYQEIRAFGRRG